ncbi:Rbh1p Ecym_8122 [Eremothecium cymbalariae DBVPG|uniref:Uncharacterized protein n=1 Tax=Eremothecium cymbalariae (strain CBS 270.75 / DBVPG 7215 / KCTC 17166 / NRRL Y-17582) TaxID=931890 RepID=G8JX39_ERECY|nr:Hypothetical protein Ecym_8122 [Eremothecium cymbalariae DBVPG\
MNFGGFQSLEEEHQTVLYRFERFLQDADQRLLPSVGPHYHFSSKLKSLSTVAQLLLLLHELFWESVERVAEHGAQEVSHKIFAQWLENEPRVLESYDFILTGVLELLFESKLIRYQIRPNSEFIALVLEFYSGLSRLSELTMSGLLRLLLEKFQNNFVNRWNKINSSTLLFDKVEDLFSHNRDIVSPPLFGLKNVVKRDFFELTLPKFGYYQLLVEVFQLDSGEIAIFKVNNQALPYNTNDGAKLLNALISGSNFLADIGRSLLFSTLGKSNFSSVREIPNGIELKAEGEVDFNLTLKIVNNLGWEEFWRSNFQMVFGTKCSKLSGVETALAATRSVSHPLQKFKLKHEKLLEIRSPENFGLGLQLPSQNLLCPETALNASYSTSEPSVEDTTQKKSVSDLNAAGSLNNPATENLASLSYSLNDMESSNHDSLLRFEESISTTESEFDFCPKANQSVASQSMKITMEEVSPISSSEKRTPQSGVDNVSTKLLESANITKQFTNEIYTNVIRDVDEQEAEDFQLTFSMHKPQLLRKKNMQLFSLFTNRSSKSGITERNKVKFSGDNRRYITPFPKISNIECSNLKANHHISARERISIGNIKNTNALLSLSDLPFDVDILNNHVIFDGRTNVSCWSGYSWLSLSSDWMRLLILENEDGEYFCIVQNPKRAIYQLILRFSGDWRIDRSGAQDIQIRIGKNDCLSAVSLEVPRMIMMRCPEIESLINCLHLCIQYNSPSVLPKEIPTVCLSPADPCKMTEDAQSLRSLTSLNDCHSDTVNDYLHADAIFLLLVPKLQVRLHTYTSEHGWKLKKRGLLDIYTQKCNSNFVGYRFELVNGDEKEISYSTINGFRKYGRTGISIGVQLFQFKNQCIADEVFNLLSSVV